MKERIRMLLIRLLLGERLDLIEDVLTAMAREHEELEVTPGGTPPPWTVELANKCAALISARKRMERRYLRGVR